MKKLFIWLLIVSLVILCLVSCEEISNIIDSVSNGANTETAHEHNFGEWQYDEVGHWCSWDCTTDACDIDTYDEHYDNNDNSICDACGYVMAEHKHISEEYCDSNGHGWTYICGCITPPNFALHSDSDNDGKCDVCDFQIPDHICTFEWVRNEDGHYRNYTCGCPSTDILEPHVGIEYGETFCSICDYYVGEIHYLTDFNEWLIDLSPDMVTEIKTISFGLDVPNYPYFELVQRTTDKNVILEMIEACKSVELFDLGTLCFEITDSSYEIDFILTDGSVETIRVSGNILCHGHMIKNVPRLDDYENKSVTYSFFRSNCVGTVNDDKKVNLSGIEFVETEIFPDNEAYYHIVVREDTIDIHDNHYFAFKGKYYKTLEVDLFEMIREAS